MHIPFSELINAYLYLTLCFIVIISVSFETVSLSGKGTLCIMILYIFQMEKQVVELPNNNCTFLVLNGVRQLFLLLCQWNYLYINHSSQDYTEIIFASISLPWGINRLFLIWYLIWDWRELCSTLQLREMFP